MLNDNVPARSQILPFYLADGSSDVALIRGRMASVGPAASTIIERHAYPIWSAVCKQKLWRWPPVCPAL